MTIEQIAAEDMRLATYHEPVKGKMLTPDSYEYNGDFWQMIFDDYKSRGMMLSPGALALYREIWLKCYRSQYAEFES